MGRGARVLHPEFLEVKKKTIIPKYILKQVNVQGGSFVWLVCTALPVILALLRACITKNNGMEYVCQDFSKRGWQLWHGIPCYPFLRTLHGKPFSLLPQDHFGVLQS